jgi:hypothetical protein
VIQRKVWGAAPAVVVSLRRVNSSSDDSPAIGERRSHWQQLAYRQTRWRGRRCRGVCWTLLLLRAAVVVALGSSDNGVYVEWRKDEGRGCCTKLPAVAAAHRPAAAVRAKSSAPLGLRRGETIRHYGLLPRCHVPVDSPHIFLS